MRSIVTFIRLFRHLITQIGGFQIKECAPVFFFTVTDFPERARAIHSHDNEDPERAGIQIHLCIIMNNNGA